MSASSFSVFVSQGPIVTCDAFLTLFHPLHVALNRGMERRLVQLDFSVAFDRVSHPGLLYKLRPIVLRTVLVHSIGVP